jgi:two-component system sensor histidine kinase MprB
VSYRKRLTLLTCIAISVTLVAASFVAWSLARSEAYEQIDTALEDRIILTRAFQDLEPGWTEEQRRAASRGSSGPHIPGVGPGAAGGFTRVLDSAGREVEEQRRPPRNETNRPRMPRIDPKDLPERVRDQFRRSDDVDLPLTSASRELAKGDSRDLLHETVHVDGTPYRLVSGRVDGGYTVQVGRPIAETEEFLDQLALLLALVTLGGIGAGLGAALIVTRAASAPVHRLTELTETVRESGDLSKRIEVTGTDDLGRLAASANAMLEELEGASIRQQRLVDDASHQLRTPLASIRTNVDVLERSSDLDPEIRRDILADLSAQVDEMTSLVRDLVDLASGVESDVERSPVQLDEAAIEAVRRVRGAFAHVAFETHVVPCTVEGSEERLVRMVQNLLHNAGKWSPDGATVEAHVTSDCEVRVVDHGSGVADAEKPRIFERFHRAADARDVPGSGLGLSIVQQVAVDHGGSVHVEDTPGGGATFIVRLPCVD